jgi:DNA helicase II / ATP-dependent DNA helicase PcrA
MQERLRAMLPGKLREGPLVTTFHSLCVRILRRHISRLGYPARFAIYAGGDQEAVARSVLREVNVADAALSPSQLVWQVSAWKSRGLSPDAASSEADSDRATLAAIAYRRYQQELKRLGAVDFDDLLLLVGRLFSEHPDVLTVEAGRFDQILVDEYQDTNGSQYRIVRALAQGHRNLCVVGDDDQSIYGWRGAEVRHILAFRKDWPDAVTVRLEENYRSCDAILKLANTLIRFNRIRHDKQLVASRPGGTPPAVMQFPDEAAEARETVAAIAARIATGRVEPRHCAVLFRTNEQPRLFEQFFRKARVPYVLVGTSSFFDRKEVQDIVAWLRLVDGNEDDATLLRVLQRPRRGVGEKAIEALVTASIERRQPVWQVATDRRTRPALSSAASAGLEQLIACIEETRELVGKAGLATAVSRLIERSNYRQEIDRCYTEATDRELRWNSVQQVVNAVADHEREHKEPALSAFLDEIMLGDREVEDEKEKQLRRNAVALMTLHSAKGLEFPEVWLVGMEENILPHFRALEDGESGVDEERRLCYVGLTRAQDRLTLSMALTRLKWGKPRDSIPSRFLYEMTGQAEHPNYRKVAAGKAAISE